VAPISKGMVLTARFGTWLEIGARAIGQCGGLSSGRELAWWQCRDSDRLDLRAGGQRAARWNCASSLCARPLFTSPVEGEPVACLFDSVSRQKTYELGSWSGHEPGRVWARLQCTHVWLTRVRTERGCARSG